MFRLQSPPSSSGKFHLWQANVPIINPLTPNDHYRGRAAPLTSKHCILYIYSTNIGTGYFKHGIYSPFFSIQNAVCFIILTYLVPVLFTFYIQDVLKLKKSNSAPKVKKHCSLCLMLVGEIVVLLHASLKSSNSAKCETHCCANGILGVWRSWLAVGTVAVRLFASAVLICFRLDAVQVPGGQENFSDEQLRRTCGLIVKGYVWFGLVFYRLFQEKQRLRYCEL